MMTVKTKLTEGGRIVIPADFRQAMGLEVGDDIMLRMENGEVRLFTLEQAMKRAQEIVRRYVPEGRSIVDEFIAERRAEAANE